MFFGITLCLLGVGSTYGLNVCPYLNKSISSTSNAPVLIPGFEKSGTTELFNVLNSSGCFNTGIKKELKFLNRFCVPQRMKLSKKTTFSYFRHCPKVKECSKHSDYLKCWPDASVAPPLDGTPAYSHTILLKHNKLVSAATELQYLSPSSSSIWLLRNPVERTVSSYYFFTNRNGNLKCTLERKVQQEIEYLQGNHFLTQVLLKPPKETTAKSMAIAWARLRKNFRSYGYKKYSKYCPATPEIIIGSLYLPMIAHWVSSLNRGRHMFLSSEFFFTDPKYIAAGYVVPFVFQSEKTATFLITESTNTKPSISNNGKYNHNEKDEINCVLHCFFSPFSANLFLWLAFLQGLGNVEVFPSISEFGWNTARVCNCTLPIPV